MTILFYRKQWILYKTKHVDCVYQLHSKWKLTPALGWIMVVCYFIWAGNQIYQDFASSVETAALC